MRLIKCLVMMSIVPTLVLGSGAGTAGAANPWPQVAVGGMALSSAGGGAYGFVVVFANGETGWLSPTPCYYAPRYGAFFLFKDFPLAAPIVGGAVSESPYGAEVIARAKPAHVDQFDYAFYLVGADGGVFACNADPDRFMPRASIHYFGSMGGRWLHRPVVGIDVMDGPDDDPDADGYWLGAADGGVFSFGAARFHGSMGNRWLSQPVVGISATITGNGYRLVARDGGVFAFGDAAFYGSLPGSGTRVTDVVGIARTPSGKGYWIARASGEVHAFGDAARLGTYRAAPNDPVVGITSHKLANRDHAQGYRLVLRSGAAVRFGDAP